MSKTSVAYLVTAYPAVSHTFIRREVAALREQGVDVHTFSVRASAPHEALSAADLEAARTTTSLLPVTPLHLLQRQLALLLRAPHHYVTALVAVLRCGRGARGRLWQLFHFAEAVLLRAELCKIGVHHVHAHFANAGADIARAVVEIGRHVDGEGVWSWSFSMHGPTEFADVRRFGLRRKVEDAEFVACISDYCRSQLMALVDEQHWDKLLLVRCGIDLATFPPVDRPPRAGLRVLCVGRLVPEKGQGLLVEAVAQLVAEGQDVELALVGTGPRHAALEGLVARAGLQDRVTIAGAVGQDDIGQWYAWADVFALLSFAEGLPVVLMEALASGLPVVTTAVAGIGELVVDGENGRLLRPGRVDLAVEALGELARDPELRRLMAAHGRRAVAAQHDIRHAVVPLRDRLLLTRT